MSYIIAALLFDMIIDEKCTSEMVQYQTTNESTCEQVQQQQKYW